MDTNRFQGHCGSSEPQKEKVALELDQDRAGQRKSEGGARRSTGACVALKNEQRDMA